VAAADPLAVNPYLRLFLPASHSSSQLLDNPGTNASRTNEPFKDLIENHQLSRMVPDVRHVPGHTGPLLNGTN
jgi:hypothetical protein